MLVYARLRLRYVAAQVTAARIECFSAGVCRPVGVTEANRQINARRRPEVIPIWLH